MEPNEIRAALYVAMVYGPVYLLKKVKVEVSAPSRLHLVQVSLASISFESLLISQNRVGAFLAQISLLYWLSAIFFCGTYWWMAQWVASRFTRDSARRCGSA